MNKYADRCLYCRGKAGSPCFFVVVDMPLRTGVIQKRKGKACSRCIIDNNLPLSFDLTNCDLGECHGQRVGDYVAFFSCAS